MLHAKPPFFCGTSPRTYASIPTHMRKAGDKKVVLISNGLCAQGGRQGDGAHISAIFCYVNVCTVCAFRVSRFPF